MDLKKLLLQQLNELQSVVEQEFNQLTRSFQALKIAQAKMLECINNIDSLKSSERDEVFVHMTDSLYIPGKISDKNQFLVDVGTGYFIEKQSEDAKKIYNDKIEKLEDDSKKLSGLILQKQSLLKNISALSKTKMV